MHFVSDTPRRTLVAGAAVVGVLTLLTGHAGAEDPIQVGTTEFRRLVWLNNWIEAADLLERDPQVARSVPQALVEAVNLRGHLESAVLPNAAARVSSLLESAEIKDRPHLRVLLLAIKGDVEFQRDLKAAQSSWQEVLAVAEAGHLDTWASRARGELGTIAFLRGDVVRALNYVARAYFSAEYRGDVAAQIRYRTALGEGLAEFGRLHDAERFFDRALALSRQTPGAYFPFTAFLGKAKILARTNRTDVAMRMLLEGLADTRRRGLAIRETRLLVALADVAEQLGDRAQRIAHLERAALNAQRLGLSRIQSSAALRLAGLLREAGATTRALLHARNAFATAESAGDKYHLPQLLAEIAECESSLGQSDEAERTFVRAHQAVEHLLAGLAQGADRATLVATMGRVFHGHLRHSVSRGNLQKAFAVIEGARTAAIADVLLQRRASPPALKPAGVASSEQEGASWEAEVRSYRVSDFSAGIRTIGTSVLAVGVQRRLPPDAILIHYVLGRDESHALAVTSDGLSAHRLPPRSTIEQRVIRLTQAVAKGQVDLTSSAELFDFLLKPVEAARRCKRLIIVPDGLLHLVPFEALTDEDGRFLVQSKVVSYLPAAALLDVPSRRTLEKPLLLAVGGAAYVGTATPDIVFRAALSSWSVLPQSRREIQEVAQLAGRDSTVLEGAQATEGALKAMPLERFSAIHLAVHSTVDRQFPRRSALVLPHRPGEREDGYLQASEVLSLPLAAELVTLSSCEGAVGHAEGVAGVDSLVQSFLLAGARTVVASVWPAEDAATAELMKHFYTNLRNGHDKATALAMAKREILTLYGPDTSPLYWAGFKLHGDGYGTWEGGHSLATTAHQGPTDGDTQRHGRHGGEEALRSEVRPRALAANVGSTIR